LRAIKEFIPRVLGRMAAIDAARRERLRRERLLTIATIDPSVLIDPVATIVNYPGRRDDIVIGPLCSIQGSLMVMPQGGRIHIGQKTLVGPNSRVWSSSAIDIGSYVMISHDVNIHDNISHSLSWRERRAEIDIIYPSLVLTRHDYDLRAEPVVIEDDVWIGHTSTIRRGVRIGRGAIVGANTVVTEDVAPFTVVAGNPARVIRKLEDGE
jgi:maltose O-acetyltransferase